MSYEASAAQVLCEKFREDALRVFISGLKRSLTDVLFSAKPKDMPSALALAQEVESNHERYTFASSFARSLLLLGVRLEALPMPYYLHLAPC